MPSPPSRQHVPLTGGRCFSGARPRVDNVRTGRRDSMSALLGG